MSVKTMYLYTCDICGKEEYIPQSLKTGSWEQLILRLSTLGEDLWSCTKTVCSHDCKQIAKNDAAVCVWNKLSDNPILLWKGDY